MICTAKRNRKQGKVYFSFDLSDISVKGDQKKKLHHVAFLRPFYTPRNVHVQIVLRISIRGRLLHKKEGVMQRLTFADGPQGNLKATPKGNDVIVVLSGFLHREGGGSCA